MGKETFVGTFNGYIKKIGDITRTSEHRLYGASQPLDVRLSFCKKFVVKVLIFNVILEQQKFLNNEIDEHALMRVYIDNLKIILPLRENLVEYYVSREIKRLTQKKFSAQQLLSSGTIDEGNYLTRLKSVGKEEELFNNVLNNEENKIKYAITQAEQFLLGKVLYISLKELDKKISDKIVETTIEDMCYVVRDYHAQTHKTK